MAIVVIFFQCFWHLCKFEAWAPLYQSWTPNKTFYFFKYHWATNLAAWRRPCTIHFRCTLAKIKTIICVWTWQRDKELKYIFKQASKDWLKAEMSESEIICRDTRWSLKGTSALVTGGTRGIGYVRNYINLANLI